MGTEVDFASSFNYLLEDKYIFFDIETVPRINEYNLMDERDRKIWEKMCTTQHKLKDQWKMGWSFERIFETYSSLILEYNMIVTIAYGVIDARSGERELSSVTLHKDGIETEMDLIRKFSEIVSNYPNYKLCGYNIIGFDIPNVAKKMVKYKVPLPKQFNMFGKKPWEVDSLDLSFFWRCGTMDFISLDGLTSFLGFESPKDVISGDMVGAYFYSEENREEKLDIIEEYCKKDVNAVINLYFYFRENGILY